MGFLKDLISFFLSFFKKKQTKEALQQEKLEQKEKLVKKEVSDLDKKIEEVKNDKEVKSLEEEVDYWKKRS